MLHKDSHVVSQTVVCSNVLHTLTAVFHIAFGCYALRHCLCWHFDVKRWGFIILAKMIDIMLKKNDLNAWEVGNILEFPPPYLKKNLLSNPM